MNEELLSELSEKHLLVLFALYRAGTLNISKIRRKVLGRGKDVGNRYARSIMSELIRLGLVEEFRIQQFVFYRLTEKGRSLVTRVLESLEFKG